jgi:hypothetical protein
MTPTHRILVQLGMYTSTGKSLFEVVQGQNSRNLVEVVVKIEEDK